MDIAVIGAGAAGMTAAIAAAEQGGRVTVYEKNDRVGKKILATGNGKCNLSNLDMDVSHYYTSCPQVVEQVLEKFTVTDTVGFFADGGMMAKSKNGYLYPFSEQASTVLDILRLRLTELGVAVRCNCEIRTVEKLTDGRLGVVIGKERNIYDKVIIACGSRASLKNGEGQSGYRLAEAAGHRIVPVVPALVQLRCREDYLKALAGVRCHALIRLLIDEQLCAEERGEVQFTDYGISGIPVFQFSREAAYALRGESAYGDENTRGGENARGDENARVEKNEVSVEVDFFPNYQEEAYAMFAGERYRAGGGKNLEDFLLGLTHKKINQVMIKLGGCRGTDLVRDLGERKIREIMGQYRKLKLHVTAANSFEQAQVCAGGVSLAEVSEDLASLVMPGLYFAGEILDVDGKCGGYNLQWAWSSGYVAGSHAAGGLREIG